MAVDAFLALGARRLRSGLPAEQREQIDRAVEELMADPAEDGRSKVAVGFPFRYDSICYVTEDFLIAYYFEHAALVTVYAIVPRVKELC